MSGRNSPPAPSPSAQARRRSSITAYTLSDIFGSRPGMNSGAGSGAGAGTGAGPPGPITSAAAQAQRRLSLSTVGLSSTSSQPSSFSTYHSRTASMSSANSGSVDESPFEEGDAAANPPTSPFARRMSFGARAMREMHAGNGNNANEGFNFAESMRSRAERSSISGPPSAGPSPVMTRHKSVPTMEPPVREMPQTQRPDPFQERILKGDFYMD